MKFLGPIVKKIDAINGWMGKSASWLTFFLVIITVYDVVMRYIFRKGSVAIQEAEWHLFAMNFLLAAGWTLLNDGHVRVDLLYIRLGRRKKAWIDFIGSLAFCIPFCIMVIWAAIPFVLDSWSVWEGSSDPGGLPTFFILKTIMPLAFLLVLVQALSQAIKNIAIICGKEEKS